MVASRKTLVPAGISANGFALSAVKQSVLFGEQCADLSRRQREYAPTLRYDSLRPKGCRLVGEVRAERIAHHVCDLLALTGRLLAGAVVKALFEKRAELSTHGVMTIS
jgi:hypothetical protein